MALAPTSNPMNFNVGDIGTSTATATLGDTNRNIASGSGSTAGSLLGASNIILLGALALGLALIFRK